MPIMMSIIRLASTLGLESIHDTADEAQAKSRGGHGIDQKVVEPA